MEPRNYLANAGANPPAAPAAPSNGYPQTATPGVNQATVPGPYWYYKIGEELRALITAGGITPNDADLGQVIAGLRRLHQWGDGIYAGDTGAADAYVVGLTPAVTVAHDIRFRVLIANTNAGASTIDFGIGAKQIVGRAAVDLEGGELPAGSVATFDYDSGADLVTLVDCTEGPQQISQGMKPHQAVNLEQMQSITTPTGAIAFFGFSSPPSGWIKANGATISRITYADLFGAIGTTFGAGDGATTFQLPDLRGEFIRGFDDARGVDAGRVLGSWQADAIRNITGYFNPKSGAGADGVASGAFYNSSPTFGNALSSSGGYTGYSVNLDASRVVPVADENRPRNTAFLACIKY